MCDPDPRAQTPVKQALGSGVDRILGQNGGEDRVYLHDDSGQLAELSAQKMSRIPQDVVGRIVAEHKAHFHATG